MKVFAANAILPYDFEYKVPSADVGSKWKELVSRVVIDLAVGMKVSVENDNTYVLTSVNGRRKCCIGKDLQGFPWRIKYSQINWFETAELNGIFVPDPIYFSKFKELAVAI